MNKKEIIINYILNNIKTGKWKLGKRILSEADIAKYNNVSKNTVREAKVTLVNEGILYQRRGSGTYVKSNNFEKKYIVIIYENFFFKEIIGTVYRYIIEKIKFFFDENNYTPLLVEIGKEKENINVEFNHIAAIVKMTQLPSSLDTIAINNNIPVIEYGCDNTQFASVKYETILQFIYINNLIEKYNFKDIVIFIKNYEKIDIIGNVIHKLYNYHFNSKGYKVFNINDSYDMNNAPSIIQKGLMSITTPPDVIIFLDDNIYKCGYEIYPLFDKLLTQTKIITFSTGNERFNPKYKICKIYMNLDEISQQIFNLTTTYINNENKTIKNIVVKPTIIGEENLL